MFAYLLTLLFLTRPIKREGPTPRARHPIDNFDTSGCINKKKKGTEEKRTFRIRKNRVFNKQNH